MKINKYTIKNIWLKIRSWVGSRFNGDGQDFKNTYWDIRQDFRYISAADLYTLYARTMPWGQYFDDSFVEWFDPSGVSIDSSGVNFVWTGNKLTAANGTIINNGIGFILSKDSYGYGYYEWELLMPKGVGFHNAIWLSGKNSWPPEIDIMEGYSDKKGKWTLSSNIHRQGTPVNPSDGAMQHGYLVDPDLWYTLSLEYTAESIKMYYDGWFVREEKGIAGNPEMLVIMGTGLQPGFTYTQDRPMTVKSFKYKKI